MAGVPPGTHKSLIWRRTLLSPKLPTRKADFSAALQEWENEVDRYAAEFGAERRADKDKRALLITESPAALKQHLAMHAAALPTYEQVRAVVVSYVQAERVWIPTATHAAGHTARARDPDAMNIDKVDEQKGKGKGKQDNKGKKGESKRKATAKRMKIERGKNSGKKKDKEKGAICWRNRSTQDCWHNAKGQRKQHYDATSGKGRGNVQAVNEENMSTALMSVGPSVSHAGSTAGNVAKSGIRRVYDRERVMRIGEKNTTVQLSRCYY